MDLGSMYRDIVETSPDGIWMFDLQGRTLYANPAIAQLLGVPEAEVAAMTVMDSLDEVGRQQFLEHLADLRAGLVNEDEVEVRFQRRDGTAFWMLVRESPVHDEHGALRGALHRFSDYTGRRRVLDELRSSQEQLAEAQTIARLGGWTWDLPVDEIHCSPELLALYGLDPSSFPATYEDFLAVVHPEDRSGVDEAVQLVLDGAVEFLFEARVQAADGWVWTRGRGVPRHDAAGTVVAMSGTHQDITESKQAELELLDLVTQNTLLQAVAVAANEAGTLREVLSHARSLVLLHDDWERGRAFMPDADATGVVPLYVSETDRVEDLGREQELALELEVANLAFHRRAPVWDERRLTIGFPVSFQGEVCAVLTITSAPPLYRHAMIEQMAELVAVQLGRVAERERSEQAIADARDAAMEASRQKSEFLATMSHEIRTPLNGVVGLNDLLLRSGLTHDQHRLSSGVQVASRALLGVINDILDFSKMEAGKMELEHLDFEVRPVFDQIAGVLGESARSKGLELIVSCHPDVPETVSGDPTRLAQVLTNLVSNAVKFTEAGEVFVRATAQVRTGGTIELGVQVTDTGVGIDRDGPADIDALFAPFTQADASTTRVYGGTGLGLAISREIVGALGGVLSYAPNPDGGSVFSFTAVFEPPTGSEADPADDRARRLLSGKRVLVVDDNTHNRMILVEQLGWWRVRAVAVASADDAVLALARARDAGDPFDGALLDMAMPLRDGLDLAREVRADPAYDDLVMLMLTSFTTVRRDAVAEVGIADCLNKPVLAHVLRGALVTHLAHADLDAEPTDGPVRDASLAPHRVLVVEDNPVNQMVATGLLESMGYAVDLAEDGVHALQATARQSFDAILMDVQMPRMDGYAATRAIREREAAGRRTPIVAMTAAAVDGERERCLASGMDDFLTKPVDPRALGRVLAGLLTGSSDGPDGSDGSDPEGAGRVVVPPGAEGLEVVRLDMLRDLDVGNTAYLDRAIGNFLANSVAAVVSIREAILAGDAAGLRMVSHKLVGSALNLGVTEAAAAGRSIEFISDAGTVEGALELVPVLEEALTRGRAALLAYQSSYSRGGA